MAVSGTEPVSVEDLSLMTGSEQSGGIGGQPVSVDDLAMVVQSMPKVEEVEYTLQSNPDSYEPTGWWVYYTNSDFEVIKQTFNASAPTSIHPVKGTLCQVDCRSGSEWKNPTIIPEPTILNSSPIRPLFEA